MADWTATSGRAFRATQQWSGERKISACIEFCRQEADRPLGELSVFVLWEGLGLASWWGSSPLLHGGI